MSSLLSPFVTKELACPVCRERYHQRFFRQRIFFADKKESDQHVLEYKWTNDKFRQVHPPYYFLFYCPHCNFVDTSEEYSKPFASDYGPMVLRAIKNKSEEAQSVVDVLASKIVYDEIDFESAMSLHLLGLYLHSLAEEEYHDTYKLARLYLRTAWLYRESNTKQPEPDEGKVEQSHPQQNTSHAIQQVAASMEKSLQMLEQRSAALSELAANRVKELGGEIGVNESDYPYAEAAQALGAELARATEAVRAIKEICERDITGALLRATGDDSAADSASPQFMAFLRHVKGLWPALPMNENEALRLAIKNFNKALSRDTRLSSHDSYYTVVFLVADLYVRSEDYGGALGMLRGIYKSAMDARKRYMQQMRQEGLSSGDKRRLEGRINRVNTSLEHTGEFRRELIDQYISQNKAIIAKVIGSNSGQELPIIEKALMEEGIPQDVLPRLKEQGGPLAHLKAAAKR